MGFVLVFFSKGATRAAQKLKNRTGTPVPRAWKTFCIVTIQSTVQAVQKVAVNITSGTCILDKTPHAFGENAWKLEHWQLAKENITAIISKREPVYSLRHNTNCLVITISK